MNPNPYYQNWSYGYTLAPDTEQSRGAYTMYGQVQGSNQANLSTIQPHGAGTWAQIKQEYPNSGIKNQMFVTSSNSTLKSEVEEQMIGPVKPASEPPAQIDPVKALAKLHELAFTNKLVERFEKVQDPEAGNPQMTEYVVKLFIGTEEYEGRGTNLKCARQNAALKALSNTKYQTAKEKKLTMFNTAKRIGVTATSELHEIAAKKGVHVDFKFLEPYNFEFKHSMRMWSKKDMLGNYRVQLNVAGYEFYGQAELPQQAKHNASTQALPIVRQMADPSGAGKVIAKPGGLPIPEEEESVPVSGDVKNTTMLLNEIAMTNNCTPEWTLLSETGPAHARIYT
ncbi:double-stranded RNA-binding protein Staufen homolog 2 [Eurytemora carolleeae]|uniref:double-stranded RNA-binding protein Staufen homolog 2 n=1 Tax=Eurytemora carolleeae TaxID=1294199 RepID=UPI000C7610CC|nr:double-stranded RNA-binding protein Staufen homolog 2 [Eurytemora carolleeae]|eukprot:XP_023347323.1 double-stranded RNA-binding protein Staufen homolog 2-like [Eurytemora affinis]